MADIKDMKLTVGFRDGDEIYSPANLYNNSAEAIAQVYGIPINGTRGSVETSNFSKHGLAVADRIAACVNACAGIDDPGCVESVLTEVVKIDSEIRDLMPQHDGRGFGQWEEAEESTLNKVLLLMKPLVDTARARLKDSATQSTTAIKE